MKDERTRRQFIRDVSLLSSSAVLGASMPWLKAMANEPPVGNGVSDRVRFGFVGVGDRGRALLLNCQQLENVEIAAIK